MKLEAISQVVEKGELIVELVENKFDELSPEHKTHLATYGISDLKGFARMREMQLEMSAESKKPPCETCGQIAENLGMASKPKPKSKKGKNGRLY